MTGIILRLGLFYVMIKVMLSSNILFLRKNTQIFASKYKLYLHTEDKLRYELEREYRALEYEVFQKKDDKS